VGDVPLEQEIEDVGGKVFSNVMYEMPPELQRPVMFNLPSWTSAMQTGEVVSFETYPSGIFNRVQNLRMRLANRSLFACDISVKVYVQSVAKQAGALVLTMSPMSKRPTNIYEAMSGPHVVLNAGAHVSGEIIVPYVRDTRTMVVRAYGTGLAEELFDFVDCQLMVLSPLQVTDGTDVKLVCVAQILNPVYTGSGFVDIPIVNQGKKTAKPTTVDPKPASSSKEKDPVGKPSRPEQYAKAAANTLNTIAGAAVTVGKIIGTGLEIAAMIGLSKPMVEHKITPMGSVRDLFMTNGDGQFCGYNMSVYQDAKTIAHPLVFGKEDPMDISNIAARSGLAGTFEWSDTDGAGDVLCRVPITPGVSTFKSVNKVHHTPLSLLSHLFRRWRGKINMRIRLFVTPFHAGQLEIIANYGSLASVNTESRAACCHRCVLDISNNNIVELNLGFYYNSPVEETVAVPFNGSFPDCLFIRCLSQLNATSDVSPVVYGTVEVWSDDIEFGVPGINEYHVPAQVLNQGIFADSLLHTIEDGKVNLCDDWDVNMQLWDRFIAGERINNLRQVTRRMMVASNGASLTIDNVSPIAIMENVPWLSAARQLFVFQIGGWRVGLYDPVGSNIITYSDAGQGNNSILSGYATIIAHDDENYSPVQMNLPNMYKYGVWVMDDVGSYNDKSFALRVIPQNKKYIVTLSLADDATWGGLNYISYDSISVYIPQRPANLLSVR